MTAGEWLMFVGFFSGLLMALYLFGVVLSEWRK